MGPLGNFLSSLFDFSFKRFVTPQLVTFIYWIAIICALLQMLLIFKAAGVIGIVLAPISAIATIVLARAGLELVLAVFQIARYSAEIARRGRPQTGENLMGMDSIDDRGIDE